MERLGARRRGFGRAGAAVERGLRVKARRLRQGSSHSIRLSQTIERSYYAVSIQQNRRETVESRTTDEIERRRVGAGAATAAGTCLLYTSPSPRDRG